MRDDRGFDRLLSKRKREGGNGLSSLNFAYFPQILFFFCSNLILSERLAGQIRDGKRPAAQRGATGLFSA
ncbi:hypothetical protein DM806_14295 [Sphingobium lactosutens]|nr:hypothetical protein [Sphingobium lactosutens]